MEVEIEALLALTLKAIDLFNNVWILKPPYSSDYNYVRLLTHIIKNLTAEASSQITQRAMEIFGGIGFLKDFPIEKWHREALITPIWEGTSNIQALDMLEAIIKKEAHLKMLEDLESIRVDTYNKELASRAYELVKDNLSILNKGNRYTVEFYAKDVLRGLGYAVAVLNLLDISKRLNDEMYSLIADLYYQLKILGGIKRIPEKKYIDHILSLRRGLDADTSKHLIS